MTSASSMSSENAQEQFDIAPLSWVMTELREALTSAGNLLGESLKQDADARATSLLQAKTYLHQAHGALQIVEVEGVAIVTETVEELIERMQDSKLDISPLVVEKITSAFYAVLRYLEDLLSGNPQQPVRLFPEYRELLELKGAERIHPADLFFPSLSVQEKIPELALSATQRDINYGAIRLRFEKLLLTVLTSKDAHAQRDAAQQMGKLIREIEQEQTSSQTKAFWLVMRAFAESCTQADKRDERHIKQIWGRINLQIRRLVEGNTSVPERLLRDALFFIAQVKQPSSFVAQIRKAYQLDNHIPEDYDQHRYGLIAPQVLTSAKEQLSSVKSLWGRVANGDVPSQDKFVQKVKDLANTGAQLHTPPLAKLLKELNGIAAHAVRTQDRERMGIELATCLLFIENALEQITHLPANFAARADEISSRLLSVVGGESPGNQASWIGEISREAQQRQTMAALVGEMQLSLKQAEKVLDEHFRDPSNTNILPPVDGILAQIGGALAILDQDDALAAVNHTRGLIKSFGTEGKAGELSPLFHQVAQNIGALSFFIETLQSQPEFAKKRFSFDADSGVFQTKLLDKGPEKELLPSGDLEASPHLLGPHTAEQDLLEQQKESERLLASLVEAPQDPMLQAQLKDSLDTERSYAALLDDSEASARAKTAIELLEHADFEHPQEALEEIVAATSHVEHTPEIALTQELPETEEEIDAELLEIFLTEADEVLAAVRENIPLSRHEPHNQEYLIRLRRSFHTLKGSGRMVGLNVFGEGAWNIEQVMNLWLSETRDGTEALYQLLEYAASEMLAWVEELKQTGSSNRNADRMIAAAIAVKEGHAFDLDASLPTPEVSPEGLAPEVQVEAESESEPPVLLAPDEVLAPATELTTPTLSFDEEIAIAAEAAEAVNAADAAETTSIEITPAFEPDALPVLADQAINLEPDLTLEAEEHIELVAPEPGSLEELPQLTEVMDHIAQESDLEPVAVHVIDDQADQDFDLAELTSLEDASEEALVASVVDDALELSSEEDAELSIEAAETADLSLDTPLVTGEDIIAAETLGEETLSPNTQTAQIIEFPDFTLPASKESDNTKRIGEIEISLPLHTIYMAETDEIVRFLAQDFSEWRHEPSRPVTRHAVHAAHSLAGSSATVGLLAAQELAHSLENVLQRIERHPVELQATEFDLLDQTVECIKGMLQKFALSEMAERATQENQALEQLLAALIARSDVGDDGEFITSTNEVVDAALAPLEMTEPLVEEEVAAQADAEVQAEAVVEAEAEAEAEAEVDATAVLQESSPVETELLEPLSIEPAVELSAAVEPALSMTSELDERVAEPASATEAVTSSEASLGVMDEIDFDLLPVFLEEGNDLLPMIGSLLRSWQENPQDDAIPQSILRLMHTVKGSARMAGAMQLGQHTHDMETRIENLMHTGSAIRQPLLEDLVNRHDYAMHLFERLQNPNLASMPAPVREMSIADEMNAFQEAQHAAVIDAVEANEASAVEQTTPELTSDAEESVEVEPTDTASPAVEVAAPAAIETAPTTTEAITPAEMPAPAPAPIPTPAPLRVVAKPPTIARELRQVAPQAQVPVANTPAALVRVRADILDRLVNQAGEVSISRSKLENEVDTLKASLSELTDNISRLRDQLREVEIQAETQISSRMAFSGDREFDPLEFDRFTRLQELTRMMAESVSDVVTVQSALNRTIEGATGDLTTQARLTRELQQDLMRVRMIPFSSVSERLYRIARQAAKEMDKRVNLDIRGTSVEIDRSVLEKMVGPFEHMLRNAIVHGIETRQERIARGKNEVGELLIEIRQEGNEVVIHFTDDGQGLNLNRIRDKAKNVGLLTDESYMTESDIVNLIFEPGFSTATEITELAGRGVGMDVVRSEAASLGGRVAVASVEGKGAHFTIHLPLTLAVTQVVILNAAGKTFAVPSVLVEQVQQLKSAALATAYNEGAVMWQGARVPLHYLPSMLGELDATPDTQQYTPILIMKSDNERVAIHVDQIVGNREVVVKNVGPQLARMIGIAGATVLGSGDIVLILNPVPLAIKLEHERARLPETHSDNATPEMGAVAELQQASHTPAQTAPVQGLRTHHIVMVVDDSLTVRRVTQRLLVREGYQVALAKDGIDALEQLQSITPDVMLVDIEMPRMDGFDLTRNVRSDSRTQHIPIIMITSRTADKHRNYAMELGVNEYFGKPYREDDLLAAISNFVNKPVELPS